jgi:hypothetical protein
MARICFYALDLEGDNVRRSRHLGVPRVRSPPGTAARRRAGRVPVAQLVGPDRFDPAVDGNGAGQLAFVAGFDEPLTSFAASR